MENGFDSSDTTITSQYETQEWKDFCKHMYEWNQEGLLLPDASTSTDNAPMKTVGFADFENLNPTKIQTVKIPGDMNLFMRSLLSH